MLLVHRPEAYATYMNSVEWLEGWYRAQCNNEWEHHHGIAIETLDNPGWHVRVDLTGTAMQDVPMEVVGRLEDINHEGLGGKQDWLCCSVEENSFVGAGGSGSLFAICDVFRGWVEGKR